MAESWLISVPVSVLSADILSLSPCRRPPQQSSWLIPPLLHHSLAHLYATSYSLCGSGRPLMSMSITACRLCYWTYESELSWKGWGQEKEQVFLLYFSFRANLLTMWTGDRSIFCFFFSPRLFLIHLSGCVIIICRDLAPRDISGTSDPFTRVICKNHSAETSVSSSSQVFVFVLLPNQQMMSNAM